MRTTQCRKMAGKTEIIRKAVTFILAVCVDLCLFYASGSAVARSVFGDLVRLWVSAALRCLSLTAVTLLGLGDIRPVLLRVITAHSLLPAVFESCAKGLCLEESRCGSLEDLSCWVMRTAATLAAALFWEITIPDDTGTEGKQKARELFVRVLLLYKPLYHLLLGGLLFLSLAVICEYTAAGDEQDEEVEEEG